MMKNHPRRDDYHALIDELREFYGENGALVCTDPERLAFTAQLTCKMEEFSTASPKASPYELRGHIYDLMAENFIPKFFPDSPFYGIFGGNGGWNKSGIGYWLFSYNEKQMWECDAAEFFRERGSSRQHYLLCCGPFYDAMHNSAPHSNILKRGFRGYYEAALEARKNCRTSSEKEFADCTIRGFLAVKAILERCALEAKRKLDSLPSDSPMRRFLSPIAEHAAQAPWNPPKTFYEGLNALWFIREAAGELDGLRVNALGRPDAMLIDLYRNDLLAGRITEAEAYDLVCRFLLHGDCMYDKDMVLEQGALHENEISLTLGGCDRDGIEVFNDLTRLFLRAYSELDLIFPKPHCRFGAKSSHEYLQIIAQDLLDQRAVYSLVNDDGVIPALIRDGKTPEDAREYSCTGCWDIVVDSREDNSGGNYLNLARVLEAVIYDDDKTMAAAGFSLKRLDDAPDFDTVYRTLVDDILLVVRDTLKMEAKYGARAASFAPTPLTSACTTGCLENLRDLTAGGALYNPHAVSMCFFGNVLDSLLAICELCFERRVCSLAELLAAVRNNWTGESGSKLRRQVLSAPHWGDDRPETIELAQRLHEEFYARTRDLVNEHGGAFQLAYWTYREFRLWGAKTKALPDGRCNGDYLAQSLNPSHFRNDQPVSTVLQGLASLDLSKCAGNTVINLVLEKDGLTPVLLDSLLRVFAGLKLQLLQLNCMSREELLEAQKNPEAHRNLIVRVCGFSIRFTSLSREWQNEFIRRRFY